MRRNEILNIDDEPLPVPDAGTDVAHAIYLLEYARRNDFRVGPMIRVGSLIMQVSDLRQNASGAKDNAVDPSAWAAAGYEE